MEQCFYSIEKRKLIVSNKNKVNIKISYLQESKVGLRIVEYRFSFSNIVEMRLIYGDDIVIKKNNIDIRVLENPNKQQIREAINILVEVGIKLGYYKK